MLLYLSPVKYNSIDPILLISRFLHYKSLLYLVFTWTLLHTVSRLQLGLLLHLAVCSEGVDLVYSPQVCHSIVVLLFLRDEPAASFDVRIEFFCYLIEIGRIPLMLTQVGMSSRRLWQVDFGSRVCVYEDEGLQRHCLAPRRLQGKARGSVQSICHTMWPRGRGQEFGSRLWDGFELASDIL